MNKEQQRFEEKFEKMNNKVIKEAVPPERREVGNQLTDAMHKLDDAIRTGTKKFKRGKDLKKQLDAAMQIMNSVMDDIIAGKYN